MTLHPASIRCSSAFAARLRADHVAAARALDVNFGILSRRFGHDAIADARRHADRAAHLAAKRFFAAGAAGGRWTPALGRDLEVLVRKLGAGLARRNGPAVAAAAERLERLREVHAQANKVAALEAALAQLRPGVLAAAASSGR